MSDDEPEQENYESDDNDNDSDVSQRDADEVPKPKLIIGEAIPTNIDNEETGSLDDEAGGPDSGSETDGEPDDSGEESDGDKHTSPDEYPKTNVSDKDSDDDDDDEVVDEDYLKRFDKDVISNYIDLYHPESRTHNYDEVRALSFVIRDVDGVIIDELHKTLPFLTKFEKAKVLGIRAKQINEGAQPFIKTQPTVVAGYTIAQLELSQKKIPFIIRRPIPNGGSEYWKLSDLELII